MILDTVNAGVVGVHQWDLLLGRITDKISKVRLMARAPILLKLIVKELLVSQVGYLPSIFFAKLAIFLLFLQLFSPNQRTRYLIYCGIAFTGMFYLACALVEIIACTPSKGQSWLEASSSSRCANDRVLGYIISIVNLASDLYLLVLPLPVVWQLQFTQRKKVAVTAVFATGILYGCSSPFDQLLSLSRIDPGLGPLFAVP